MRRSKQEIDAAWEAEVIDQVRCNNGFSVFWVAERGPRAKAADRLVANGKIVNVEGGQFPWCRARLAVDTPDSAR